MHLPSRHTIFHPKVAPQAQDCCVAGGPGYLLTGRHSAWAAVWLLQQVPQTSLLLAMQTAGGAKERQQALCGWLTVREEGEVRLCRGPGGLRPISCH